MGALSVRELWLVSGTISFPKSWKTKKNKTYLNNFNLKWCWCIKTFEWDTFWCTASGFLIVPFPQPGFSVTQHESGTESLLGSKRFQSEELFTPQHFHCKWIKWKTFNKDTVNYPRDLPEKEWLLFWKVKKEMFICECTDIVDRCEFILKIIVS